MFLPLRSRDFSPNLFLFPSVCSAIHLADDWWWAVLAFLVPPLIVPLPVMFLVCSLSAIRALIFATLAAYYIGEGRPARSAHDTDRPAPGGSPCFRSQVPPLLKNSLRAGRSVRVRPSPFGEDVLALSPIPRSPAPHIPLIPAPMDYSITSACVCFCGCWSGRLASLDRPGIGQGTAFAAALSKCIIWPSAAIAEGKIRGTLPAVPGFP